MSIILRPPYYKKKGYCPNPIVKFGIPKEADSVNFPRVLGTVAHEQFWYEELYRIKNGYQIGGLWIPGRYYYYMNYTTMSTIKGIINPDPTDLHLELAYLIEYCKLNGKNLMIPKGRRRGISEATHPMVIDYGARFSVDKYQAGVAAGHSKPINDFITKWKFADAHLPPELYYGRLTKNDDEIIFGYSQKNDIGAWEDRGTFNTIYTRTMHTDTAGLKGLYLNDVVVEEVGEFEHFLQFFADTRDCLMNNQRQIGSMFVYGTGGNVNKGSHDFKKAWSRSEKNNFINSNNFERFVVPASRFYFYGGATEIEHQLPLESSLYLTHKPFELIGVEDIHLSEKDILRIRAEKLSSGDIKDYNNFVQNNPINELEIFRKTVINDFDVEKINKQRDEISSSLYPKWTKYKLSWVKDDKGMPKMPLSVLVTPLQPRENQEECIWIIDSEKPRKGHTNLYVAGLDGYDQNKAIASKSLGGMCVMIRNNVINHAMKMAPVAVICCRPARKETFYEMCMMLAVYYNLRNNVLVDVGAALVMEHFRTFGLYDYLADRPRKFESETSDQTHEKGVRLTNFSRPRMVGLMQTHIIDHCEDIWFDDLLDQLGNFDNVEVGSDNDLADAYGLALMQDISCDVRPRDQSTVEDDTTFDLPGYIMGESNEVFGGGIRPKLDSEEQDNPMFGR